MSFDQLELKKGKKYYEPQIDKENEKKNFMNHFAHNLFDGFKWDIELSI